MKTFEEALKRAIDAAPFTPGLDEGEYNDGFIDGLYYAQELIDKYKNDAINEILTKYMEWVDNTSGKKFADWLHEEGGHEKGKTRVRKEFINYLNEKK